MFSWSPGVKNAVSSVRSLSESDISDIKEKTVKRMEKKRPKIRESLFLESV